MCDSIGDTSEPWEGEYEADPCGPCFFKGFSALLGNPCRECCTKETCSFCPTGNLRLSDQGPTITALSTGTSFGETLAGVQNFSFNKIGHVDAGAAGTLVDPDEPFGLKKSKERLQIEFSSMIYPAACSTFFTKPHEVKKSYWKGILVFGGGGVALLALVLVICFNPCKACKQRRLQQMGYKEITNPVGNRQVKPVVATRGRN